MVPKNKSLSTAASVIRALTVAGNANILEIWYKNHQQDISSANIMALLLVILLWYCNGMESCCRQNGYQSPGTRTGPSILSCMIHLYSDWHHISCCAVTYSQSTSSVVAAKTRSQVKWPTSTKWMTPQTDNPVSTCHDASGRHWTDFVQVMASVMLAKRYSNWPALTCAHAVMSHIANACPLTKLDGGLSQLHSVDDATVTDWLWKIMHSTEWRRITHSTLHSTRKWT